MLGREHGEPEQALSLGRYDLLRLFPHGIRQAALDRFSGGSASGAYSEPVLFFVYQPVFDELGKAVGIFKIAEAFVALLCKVLKVDRRDGAGKPAKQEQNEYFYVELFVDEAKSLHDRTLLQFAKLLYIKNRDM